MIFSFVMAYISTITQMCMMYNTFVHSFDKEKSRGVMARKEGNHHALPRKGTYRKQRVTRPPNTLRTSNAEVPLQSSISRTSKENSASLVSSIIIPV
jgi:hypothetical protein